jgi:uncharacterized protein YfaS (alpha-2-macroglobulin family)
MGDRRGESQARGGLILLLTGGVILWGLLTALLGLGPGGTVRAVEGEDAAGPQVRNVRFSLSTLRTYYPKESPRVYLHYQGVEALDFRVYQIRDPLTFFRQLEDPHQMGVDEYTEVGEIASRQTRQPSVLEKVRVVKRTFYYGLKSYVRRQLARPTRTAFNERFLGGEQRPLLEADFARVPLLNPDQLVRSWRQLLPRLSEGPDGEGSYDTRMVTIGPREPGVYLVEAVHENLRAYTIALVTDLSVITKTTSDGEMLVAAVDRRTGAPRADVSVEVVRRGSVRARGKTDGEGILQVRLAPEPRLPSSPDGGVAEEETSFDSADYLVVARLGDQLAVSDLSSWYFRWHRSDGPDEGLDEVTSYVYTDRPLYRPGQTVYFKGILRQMVADGYRLLPFRTLTVRVSDAQGAEIERREFSFSPRGTFSGDLLLSDTAALGDYRLAIQVGETVIGSGYFQVAEYKKPEYRVTVTTNRRFVPAGQKARFAVDAQYFIGEPVRGAEVQYYLYRSRYHHWWAPEGGEEDGIGTSEAEDPAGDDLYGYGNDMVAEGTGRLDDRGRFEVPFEVPAPTPEDQWDYTYRFEVQVTDASRRAIDGRASIIGTRGSTVVTASPDRYVYLRGEEARITVRASDYEGRPRATPVTLRFVEIQYEKILVEEDGYRYHEYKPRRKVLSTVRVETNAAGEGSHLYRVPLVGSIRIEALLQEGGREISSIGGFLYATDQKGQWESLATRGEGDIRLIPDKPRYQPGETARVMVVLPHDKVPLLVTTERYQVMSISRQFSEGRVLLLEVPIRAEHAPNVYLSVAYVRNGELYESSKSLVVPARDKFLQVELIPDKRQYRPRDPATYTIVTRDQAGRPVPGVEVSLGLVDEAIYQLQPDPSGDIRRAFYGIQYSRVLTNFTSAYRFIGYSGRKKLQLAQNRSDRQLANFKRDSQYAEPLIRKEFRDTAFWQADVVTGPDGRATARLTLPDNLTTWRATARAVTSDLRVGAKIDRILSRKDLILRLETPRFLTRGDVVTISGIVSNYLPTPKEVRVELQVTGGTLLDEGVRRVTLASGGEQRVEWQVAARQVGEVTFQSTAKTDTESDGIERPVPVVPMGLKQTQAVAKSMLGEQVQESVELDLPAEADPQGRRLRIELSPSVVGTLFASLDYLTSYPYGCTEQTMSSFLGNIVVAQALREVQTATIRPDNDLPRKVARGLERLYDHQRQDGSWGWWKGSDADPFLTAYVMDGLLLAGQAGFPVDGERVEAGRRQVRRFLETGRTGEKQAIEPDILAYLTYVYAEAKGADASRFVTSLEGRQASLQPYGRALLALSLLAVGEQARASRVAVEIERTVKATESEAHWETKGDSRLLYLADADLEATALSLRALARVAPRSPLLPRAARWLVASRRGGAHWQSTRHTAMAILGLTEYLRTNQELTASYTVELVLNGETVLTRRVTAAEAASGQPVVFERVGAALASQNRIQVIKRGPGTLFWLATLESYRSGDPIEAGATGPLRVSREYLRLRVERRGDAAPRWTLEPLVGPLRSGDLIVSRLTVTGDRARYLLVEDPIPAGTEQVTAAEGIESTLGPGPWQEGFRHREFRDQRTAFFVDYFEGKAVFQYALRVQIPGEWKVVPARAELMYQPEIEAHSASSTFRILDQER